MAVAPISPNRVFPMRTPTICAIALLLLQQILAFRINCGGAALPGVLPDKPEYYSSSTKSVKTYRKAPPGKPNSVYAEHSWAEAGGTLVYRLPANVSRRHFVTLRFAENYEGFSSPGKRVFDVDVGGRQLKDVDVFKATGKLFEAYDVVFESVPAPDGVVEVRISPTFRNAFVSGIDITDVKPSSADLFVSLGGKTSAPSDTMGRTALSSPSPPSSNAKTPTTVNGGKFRKVNVVGSYKPSPRLESCTVWAEGKMWVLGGKGKGLEMASFDPMKRTWKDHGPPRDTKGSAVELHHCQCVSIGAKIYAPGCWYGNWPREKTHDSIWVYDIALSKWSTEPHPAPNRRRGAAATAVLDGKIYLGAGSSGGHGPPTTLLPYLDVYDPATKKWEALPDIPDARDHTQGAIAAGYFCVVGGRLGNLPNYMGNPVKPTNCYNIAKRSWSRRADIPVPRSMAATAPTCDGRILLAGGEGIKPGVGGVAYSRTDLYDPVKDKFGPPSYLVQKRHATGAAFTPCSCGNIYVSAGAGKVGDKMALNDVEVWTPDGKVRNC